MPRPLKFPSTRGIGTCGSPGCFDPKAPGHFLCQAHTDSIAFIKQELDNNQQQPNGNFANRFENVASIKTRKLPTCCALGCFEVRVPPRSYCYDHSHLESELESEYGD